MTTIMVGHRPELMSQLDKLAVLKEGALEAFGPAATVLSRMRAVAAPTNRPALMPAKEPVEAFA